MIIYNSGSWGTHFTPPFPSKKSFFTDEDFDDSWYVSDRYPVYKYYDHPNNADPRKYKYIERYRNRNTKRKLYFDEQSSRFNIKKIKYIDLVEKKQLGSLSGRIWEVYND